LNPIAQLFASIANPDLPAKQVGEYMRFAQSDTFFHLAAIKAARLGQMKSYFAQHGIKQLYLSANLAGFSCAIDGVKVDSLPKDFFIAGDADSFNQKQAQLSGCVVIINNNDVGTPELKAAYARFYEACSDCCFIAWDWDNHHWLDVSTFLAAHTDIYTPAHHENLYLLSRYNWLIAGPVYCSSVQWSSLFLKENLSTILNAERLESPLGMHIPYAQFSFRIQMISTLNQHYPTIGFSSHSFHQRSPLDRLKEWTAHTTHWIAPVLNDVPIRIFDALITGGIPIVPASLQFMQPVVAIPRQHIVFYSPTDIIDPQEVVAKANRLFTQGGDAARLDRHQLALQQFHGDYSVRKMLGFAAETLGIDLPVAIGN
jgi:hypothetical protein